MEVWSDAFEVWKEGGSNTMEKEQSELSREMANTEKKGKSGKFSDSFLLLINFSMKWQVEVVTGWSSGAGAGGDMCCLHFSN